MFPLLKGPQQSAPTAVALAAEAPAAEVMTDTRVFPDTAAPDASVERTAKAHVSSWVLKQNLRRKEGFPLLQQQLAEA